MSDPAKARFVAINLVRLTGVALVMLGIFVLRGGVEWPDEIAYLLLAFGLFDIFVMPQLLARRWRSRDG